MNPRTLLDTAAAAALLLGTLDAGESRDQWGHINKLAGAFIDQLRALENNEDIRDELRQAAGNLRQELRPILERSCRRYEELGGFQRIKYPTTGEG